MHEDAGRATTAGADYRDGSLRVERERAAEECRRGAGVAGRGVDVGRRHEQRARTLGERRSEPTVGIGQRPRAHVGRSERRHDLTDDGKEDLFAEQAPVVEVAVVDLAVAAIAIEERTGARDARADRRGAGALAGDDERRRARPAAGLETRAGTGSDCVGRDHERGAHRARADGVDPREQRLHAGVRGARAQRTRHGRSTAQRGREEREARTFGEGRPARTPVHAVDVGGLDAGRDERAGGRFPGERERVLVGRAGRELTASPAAPRRADLGRGES
jgi:hypothetical protein